MVNKMMDSTGLRTDYEFYALYMRRGRGRAIPRYEIEACLSSENYINQITCGDWVVMSMLHSNQILPSYALL
jgi:hypothetical protein